MFATTHMPHMESYMSFYFECLPRIQKEDFQMVGFGDEEEGKEYSEDK